MREIVGRYLRGHRWCQPLGKDEGKVVSIAGVEELGMVAMGVTSGRNALHKIALRLLWITGTGEMPWTSHRGGSYHHTLPLPPAELRSL